jgi:hypothetical protein
MKRLLDFKSPQVYKANIAIAESIRKREVAHEEETPVGGRVWCTSLKALQIGCAP